MIEPGTSISLGEGLDYVTDDKGFITSEVTIPFKTLHDLDPKEIDDTISCKLAYPLKDVKVVPVGLKQYSNGERWVEFEVTGDARHILETGSNYDLDTWDAANRARVGDSHRVKGLVTHCVSNFLGTCEDDLQDMLSQALTGTDSLSEMRYNPVRLEGGNIVFEVTGDPFYAMRELGLVEDESPSP